MSKYGRLNDEKSREILQSNNDLLVAISYVFCDYNRLILASISNNILITNIKYLTVGIKSFLIYNSFQNFFDGKGIKFYFFNSYPVNNNYKPRLWIPVIPFFGFSNKKLNLESLNYFLNQSIVSNKELLELKYLCKNLDSNYLIYGNDIHINTFNNLLLRWVRIKYPRKSFIGEHHGHPYLTENYPKLIVDVALATIYRVPNLHMYRDVIRFARQNLPRIPQFEVAHKPPLKQSSKSTIIHNKPLVFLPAFTAQKNSSNIVGRISLKHLSYLNSIVRDRFPVADYKIHPANSQDDTDLLGIEFSRTYSNDFTLYSSIVVLSHCSTLLTEIEDNNLQRITYVYYDLSNRYGAESEKEFYSKGYKIITYRSEEYYD